MNYFTWSEKYSVGMPDIDAQHKRFFSIINEIFESVDSRRPEAVLTSSLNLLTDYANYHFGLEEKYFSQFSYTEAAEHINAHNMFRDAIKQFYLDRDTESDVYVTAFKIADFAEKWLQDHILNVDHKYAEFFKEHGVPSLLS